MSSDIRRLADRKAGACHDASSPKSAPRPRLLHAGRRSEAAKRQSKRRTGRIRCLTWRHGHTKDDDEAVLAVADKHASRAREKVLPSGGGKRGAGQGQPRPAGTTRRRATRTCACATARLRARRG